MRSVILATFVLIVSLAICCALGGMIGGGLAWGSSNRGGEENGGVGGKVASSEAVEVVKAPCPDGFVLIDDDYCPNLETVCLYNVDAAGNRLPGPGKLDSSCGEYRKPTVCRSKPSEMKRLRFCIAKYEWPGIEGQVPQDWMSFDSAKAALEASGDRLCTAIEWTKAAEGRENKPLPYGSGYKRDNKACNIDRDYSMLDVFKATRPDDDTAKKLHSFLKPSGSMPGCVNDNGIEAMSGNVDEVVLNEGGSYNKAPYISGLKGGYFGHVRNASRPMTTAHDPMFRWYEVGLRSCRDASF